MSGKKIDVSVELLGIKFRNPLILASGILGANSNILKKVFNSGAGGVITKTIGPDSREGYPNPTFLEPMENVILNAMGLPNPGYEAFILELKENVIDFPYIVSIFGNNTEEFVEVAGAMEDAGVKMLEINLSCPHSKSKTLMSQDLHCTSDVVRSVRKAVKIPIIVKLSPNVTNIVEFAKAAIDNGADALSAINTLQALEIDPYFEMPVLGNHVGGQSGPSIRCIAQRKVADITLAMRRDEIGKVPVIAVGGIRTGYDAIRFILLGAECVQIGSAVYYEDLPIFEKINGEIKGLMAEKGYTKLSDFRGNALNWLEKCFHTPISTVNK